MPGRGARGVVADVVVVLLLHLAAGVAIGLLLPHLADLAQATRTPDGVGTTEVELAKEFDDDGWLMVLGGLAGLALGLVLQAWRRSHEAVTILVVAAAAWGAALLAGQLAELTGPDDPRVVLAEADEGETAPAQVSIDSRAAYLVWPLTGVLGAMVALLAPPSSGPGGATAAGDGSRPSRSSGRPGAAP